MSATLRHGMIVPGAARTRNLQLRRLTLYPIELRGPVVLFNFKVRENAGGVKGFSAESDAGRFICIAWTGVV